MSAGQIISVAEEVGELAQRARLSAINLAVAAAKVKLADPGFRAANERIIQLVTRATEAAAAVERLTRQLSGHPHKESRVEADADSLRRIEEIAQEVDGVSAAIVTEVQRLSALGAPRREDSSAPGR